MCIKNFEECITRFPEHFKSIYRLVLIYMNAPERIKDLKKCKQLLLGTYTTGLGNQVQGLFTDRKNNNLFNVSENGIIRLVAQSKKKKRFQLFRAFGETRRPKSIDLAVFRPNYQNVLAFYCKFYVRIWITKCFWKSLYTFRRHQTSTSNFVVSNLIFYNFI